MSTITKICHNKKRSGSTSKSYIFHIIIETNSNICIFCLFQTVPSDNIRLPSSIRLKLKIFPYLLKSKVIVDLNPAICLQVSTEKDYVYYVKQIAKSKVFCTKFPEQTKADCCLPMCISSVLLKKKLLYKFCRSYGSHLNSLLSKLYATPCEELLFEIGLDLDSRLTHSIHPYNPNSRGFTGPWFICCATN